MANLMHACPTPARFRVLLPPADEAHTLPRPLSKLSSFALEGRLSEEGTPSGPSPVAGSPLEEGGSLPLPLPEVTEPRDAGAAPALGGAGGGGATRGARGSGRTEAGVESREGIKGQEAGQAQWGEGEGHGEGGADVGHGDAAGEGRFVPRAGLDRPAAAGDSEQGEQGGVAGGVCGHRSEPRAGGAASKNAGIQAGGRPAQGACSLGVGAATVSAKSAAAGEGAAGGAGGAEGAQVEHPVDPATELSSQAASGDVAAAAGAAARPPHADATAVVATAGGVGDTASLTIGAGKAAANAKEAGAALVLPQQAGSARAQARMLAAADPAAPPPKEAGPSATWVTSLSAQTAPKPRTDAPPPASTTAPTLLQDVPHVLRPPATAAVAAPTLSRAPPMHPAVTPATQLPKQAAEHSSAAAAASAATATSQLPAQASQSQASASAEAAAAAARAAAAGGGRNVPSLPEPFAPAARWAALVMQPGTEQQGGQQQLQGQGARAEHGACTEISGKPNSAQPRPHEAAQKPGACVETHELGVPGKTQQPGASARTQQGGAADGRPHHLALPVPPAPATARGTARKVRGISKKARLGLAALHALGRAEERSLSYACAGVRVGAKGEGQGACRAGLRRIRQCAAGALLRLWACGGGSHAVQAACCEGPLWMGGCKGPCEGPCKGPLWMGGCGWFAVKAPAKGPRGLVAVNGLL